MRFDPKKRKLAKGEERMGFRNRFTRSAHFEFILKWAEEPYCGLLMNGLHYFITQKVTVS